MMVITTGSSRQIPSSTTEDRARSNVSASLLRKLKAAPFLKTSNNPSQCMKHAAFKRVAEKAEKKPLHVQKTKSLMTCRTPHCN